MSSMVELNPNLHMLVVSANTDQILHLRLYLAKIGFKNATFSKNGIEALQLCVDHTYDVILADMEIEMLDGWLFIQEFRLSDKFPNTPIVLTGKEKVCPVGTVNLANYGVFHYLSFPFEHKVLSQALIEIKDIFSKEDAVENKYTQAKQALLAKKPKDAIQIFSGLAQEASNKVRSQVGLAQAYRNDQQFEKYAATMESIPAGDSSAIPAILLHIQFTLQNKNYHLTRTHIDKMLTLTCNSPHYYLEILKLCNAEEIHSLIKVVCKGALNRGFHFEEFYMALARAEFAAENFEEAISVLSELHKKFSANAASMNLLGISHTKLKQYDKSKEVFEKALKKFPFMAKLLFNYALCLADCGEPEAAISALEKCHEVDPGFMKAELKLIELKKLIRSRDAA